MKKICKRFNTKYLYHYTKKDNIDNILIDGKLKSKDKYIFFTGSLNDSVNMFEKEMINSNYYIDIDLKLKKREYVSKSDYVILKVPYIEDNNFCLFDFNNTNSIYDKSIVHRGYYNFNKIEILDFPKKRKFKPSLAKVMITASLFFPYNVFADSWTDDSNYDITWYDQSQSHYNINNESQFAGLAYLVNNNNITFEHKDIFIQSDMSLVNHDWEVIKDIFRGNIDGAHRILLRSNDLELFASGNDYDLTLINCYKIKLITKDGNSSDRYIESNMTIGEFKNDLISDGLFSTNNIIIHNGNVLTSGTIKENNILDDSKISIYEGYIFIKLDNDYFGISCETGDSIETIKDLIKDKKNIDPKRMKLYFNDLELQEGRILADYNILRKSILSLKLKGEIKVENSDNGIIKVDKLVADKNELVKVDVTPNNNYILKSVKIYNLKNEDVTEYVNYNNNQFTMPDYSVTIVATYEIVNPKTNDSIIIYILLGIFSLFSLIFIKISNVLKKIKY